jgi:hypothetical protein
MDWVAGGYQGIDFIQSGPGMAPSQQNRQAVIFSLAYSDSDFDETSRFIPDISV